MRTIPVLDNMRDHTSRRVLVLVLGGGAGTRLFPLTKVRAKPAVPVAGKYRLVDIAISNCINSGLRKIFVLTQYLSASLNRHVSQSFKFDDFSDGFVDILAAEQGAGKDWYQGTADAVRKCWGTLDHRECDLVLILPGDALYAMDYRQMIQDHLHHEADITIAVNTVPRKVAHHFGLVALDSWGRIYDFREKPRGEQQKGIEAPRNILDKFGTDNVVGDTFLASMGVYLFNRSCLDHWMCETEDLDFGKDIIPKAITRNRVLGHVHPGYWEDIGTIEAFYEAHMAMMDDRPPFDFHSTVAPVYTRSRNLPNTRIVDSSINRALIAEGVQIYNATVNRCIVGLRSIIGRGTKVENSILLGADFVDSDLVLANRGRGADIPLGIGENCEIRRAIVDKNVRMGNNVRIVNERGVEHEDGDLYSIRGGIVIIPKNTIIPDGTVI